MPDVDGGVLARELAVLPCVVDDSPGTDRVTNIVGTVSERGSASGDDLDERVGELDLVGVLLGGGVHTLHTGTLGSTVDTRLSGVDVVVKTVEQSDNDDGRDALDDDGHVLPLVDLTSAHGVVVKSAHGPSQRTTALPELSVEPLLALCDKLLVGKLLVLGAADGTLLRLGRGNDILNTLLGVLGFAQGRCVVLGEVVVLDNGVVGHDNLAVGGSRALEEEGTLEGVVPPESVVAVDDLAVDVGNEEEGRKNCETETSAQDDRGDVPGGLLVETKLRGALVDDGKSADSTGDKEEEGRGVDGYWYGVLAHVDDDLDEHEDAGTESSRDGGSHTETSEDGTETLSAIPSPLDLGGTHGRNTDTGNRRDQRVGRGNVGRVPCAPHDPGRGTGESAGEGQHLDAGITPEGVGRDNTVLDGFGGSGTDRDSADHLKNGTQDHGLAVGDGSRGHTGSPGVGDIVGTVVVGIEHGEHGANGKNVGVLCHDHVGGCCTRK